MAGITAVKKKSSSNFQKIGQNITTLMDACNIDATELSQQTGLPCSTISRLRSNTTEFSPNLSSLIPIAEFFHITLSQLIGEEAIDKQVYGTFKPNKIKKLSIPILNAENIMGYLDLASNQTQDTPYLEIGFTLSEKAFAYLNAGNAMEPQFPDQTLLIIDPNLQVENLDYILAVPHGKKIPIFRQILIDGEDKYLRTLNPTFNEFIKITENSHTIIGIMVQSRRNFKNPASYITNEFQNIMSGIVG